jgi:hypothetical protein
MVFLTMPDKEPTQASSEPAWQQGIWTQVGNFRLQRRDDGH